jgi:preprotein translocase subunit SecG
VFGARSGATLLTRATTVLAALFVAVAMVLTIWGQRGPGSVVGGVEPPPAPAPTAAPPAGGLPAPVTAPTTAPAQPSGNTTP